MGLNKYEYNKRGFIFINDSKWSPCYDDDDDDDNDANDANDDNDNDESLVSSNLLLVLLFIYLY